MLQNRFYENGDFAFEKVDDGLRITYYHNSTIIDEVVIPWDILALLEMGNSQFKKFTTREIIGIYEVASQVVICWRYTYDKDHYYYIYSDDMFEAINKWNDERLGRD